MTAQPKIVPLDPEKHGNLKLATVNCTEHLWNQQIIPIMAVEVVSAASYFPVVFLKDAASGETRLAGLVGLEQGENLIYKEGEANAYFAPIDVRRYPFYISKDAEQNMVTLCINETSMALSTETGDPLFSEDNEPTVVIENAKNIFSQYQHHHAHNQAFIRFLEDNDLLVEAKLEAVIEGEKRSFSGLMRIDENKFNELSDEKVVEAHRKHFTPAITGHFMSLQQTQRLVELKNAAVA